MDGLILLIILIPVIYFILLIAILNKTSAQQQSLDSLKNILSQVREQLYDLDRRIKDLAVREFSKPSPSETKKERSQENPIAPQPEPEASKLVLPEEIPAITLEPLYETQEKPAIPEEILKEKITALAEEEKEEPVLLQSKTVRPKTDWEKFIGENLANKIGIAILVLGISFFVKFAIDKDWINETGRVVNGLVSGAVLIAVAHYFRNSYRSFSSVLVGGGLTVFYFTIAFAFHQYQLISQHAAFVIMIVITFFAVVLSLLYDRLELAILATIGGFITPFLVSTGQNNYIALFTYLCILNSGLLVLSWFKKWKAINIIALFFTILIYGGWLFKQSLNAREEFPYQNAFLFATLFYVLSVAINIINNLKLNIKFGAFDFILLLSINFLYYAAGIVTLSYWNDGEYQGLFTSALGIVNLALAWIFFKQKRADRNFVFLLIGLTVTFISLTAPVQLKGNHITLFWAAEMVVLFWLYQRSHISLLKIASLLIILPLLISLLMDWSQVYGGMKTFIPVVANRGFITTLVTAAAFLIYYRMMIGEADTFYLSGVRNKFIRNTLLSAGFIFAYSAGALEIYHQFSTRFSDIAVYAAWLQLYSFVFIFFVLLVFKKSPSFSALKFGLTSFAMLIYLFSLRINYAISLEMLSGDKYRIHFIAHWAAAIVLFWLLYDLIHYFRKQKSLIEDYVTPFTWIATASIVVLLSVEMYHIIMWTTWHGTAGLDYMENLYYKAGLSIVWGICSFAMIWLGMKYRFKTLRVISLTLFTITLIKLFLYDIRNIPPGGKIAAFILLGVLLLIISFMYQRLKKIIVDDQQE